MKKRVVKKKLKKFLLISMLFSLLLLISLVLFSGTLLKTNILPNKYLIIYFIIVIVIFFILNLLSFKIKNKIVKIISYIFSFIISIIFLIGYVFLKNTNDFLGNIQEKEEKLIFNVVVLKDSNFTKIGDLKNKKVEYILDEYEKEIESNLNKKIEYDEIVTDNMGELSSQLLEKKVEALCVETSYYAMLQEEVENFGDKTKTIYEFEVTLKKDKEVNDSFENKPFIMYISGIDQYGQLKTARGRSDVNQLAVVNPLTHKILLVNTPRDYYVQLAGTSGGLKDKLTHAGMYGIDKSVETLENFYDIDISYYLKVNFDTVIKVVDAIGGVDVVSDKAFTASADKSVHIKKGKNHLNGKQALAFARERKAFLTGDRVRGENQQKVISAIISKVTSSKVLISKYNSILESLEGSFQTNMSTNTITSFIKQQINEMSGWSIETYSVSGSDSHNYTYSLGSNRLLYVMEPDMKMVNTAKEKMNTILNEK